MQTFFVETNQIDKTNNLIIILDDDVNHIKNVLRYNVGDEIQICEKSLDPQKYLCKISELFKDEIKCKIINEITTSNETNINLCIIQGLPKAEKMELILQKCTELGVKKFIPLETKRCVVKIKDNDANKKILRWQKIAEVASKQCGRDIIPKVENKITIDELINKIPEYDAVLVAYEKEKNNLIKNQLQELKQLNLKNIAVIIGPEGGFEESEIELLKNAGAKVISLGNRILRTETAPIVLSTIIIYELGDRCN